MSKTKASEVTTWTFPDLPGYVEKRGTKASSRWQRNGINHRRTHPIPFHPKNRAMIHGLHRQFVEDLIRGVIKPNATPGTTEGAKNEFYAAHAATLTAAARRQMETAFGYFFDVDLPLEDDRIYRHLVKRQTTPPEGRKGLSQQTRRKYLLRIQRFCRWLVTRGYLAENPMNGIGIPPKEKGRKTLFWEPERMAQIVQYHRTRAAEADHARVAYSHIQQAIFLDLSSLLGARPAELVRMRIEDVEKDRIRIYGKADPARGANNIRTAAEERNPRACRDEHARIRHVPIMELRNLTGERRVWQKRLQEALKEAQGYALKNGGWITMFKNTQTPNDGVTEAKKFLEIEDDPRTLRHFRHGARWHFENVLRFDSYTIADILGHTPSVSFQNYRPASGATEIAERIKTK